MLSLKAKVGIVEPDGRGVPAPHLVSGERRCRTGLAGHLRRSTQESGLLMLFRAGPQGYPPLGSPLNGAQSGECRLRPFGYGLHDTTTTSTLGAVNVIRGFTAI